MPESFVIAFNHREIENPPPVRLARAAGRPIPSGGIIMRGRFITHPQICAKVDGERQTVSIHPCRPQDPIFASLPSPRKMQSQLDSCVSCNTTAPDDEIEDTLSARSFDTQRESDEPEGVSSAQRDTVPQSIMHLQGLPAAEITNGLEIEGDLRSYIIRIGYALEAHSFWIPTDVYHRIVTSTPIQRGKKSKTFVIPADLYDGPPDMVGQISIQAAFVCSDWTLIFADHNVMITFHVMVLHHPILNADLKPGSKIWPLLWSSKHGPVYAKEPNECEAALENWRASSASKKDDTPIFLSVKAEQRVFNGYGAQETCDMLFQAVISPIMPTYLICQDSALWTRFKDAVVTYQLHCLRLLQEEPFPYVSSRHPFYMRLDAHNRFLKHVSAYWRKYVTVDQETLSRIHGFGLLDPSKTIDLDGTAKYLPRELSMYAFSDAPKAIPTTVRGKRLRLPNYVITFSAGKTATKTIKAYTPFIAQIGLDWWPVSHWASVDLDVNQVYNSTTPQIIKTSQGGVKKNSRSILLSVDENSAPKELGTRSLRSGKKISL